MVGAVEHGVTKEDLRNKQFKNHSAKFHFKQCDNFGTLEITNGKKIFIFDGSKIYVPEMMRASLLQSCYEWHQGIVRMKRMATHRYMWPGLSEDVEQIVKNCQVCIKFSGMQQQVKQVMDPYPAEAPMDKVELDIFQFRSDYYLFCKDLWSRYC